MSIHFDKIEERPPEYARLAAKGKGVGALLSMETQFELAEADGGTAMKWAADVSIAGPVGAMGQRVIQPIVNSQVKQVLAALDKQVQSAAAAGRRAPRRASARSRRRPTRAIPKGRPPRLAPDGRRSPWTLSYRGQSL